MSDFIDKLKEESKKNPLAVTATIILMSLMTKVYKTPKDAEPFMRTMTKMIKDPMYVPDKMVEMPGDHPEAERLLRELAGVLLERRI